MAKDCNCIQHFKDGFDKGIETERARDRREPVAILTEEEIRSFSGSGRRYEGIYSLTVRSPKDLSESFVEVLLFEALSGAKIETLTFYLNSKLPLTFELRED
jgi:hypothetical protein